MLMTNSLRPSRTWRDFNWFQGTKLIQVCGSLVASAGANLTMLYLAPKHTISQKNACHISILSAWKWNNPSNIRKMMEDEQWWLTGGFGATTFLEKPMLLTSPVSNLWSPIFGSYVWSHLQPLGTSSSCSQARTWVHALETVRNCVGTCDWQNLAKRLLSQGVFQLSRFFHILRRHRSIVDVSLVALQFCATSIGTDPEVPIGEKYVYVAKRML